MSYRDILLPRLRRHEGEVLKPYRDTVGKLTIGVGRNLDDKGISVSESAFMLANDVNEAEIDAKLLVQNFDSLTPLRQSVLVEMAFNMGRPKLAEFRRMLAAVRAGDWNLAADEMLDSAWSKQVGNRAKTLADAMREGA